MAQDKTRIDNNRRSLSLLDTRSVKSVLPSYFLQEYPKIVSFLEAYYDYDQNSNSPSRFLDDLFKTRDITEADIQLLSYIEDELLLGQQYFEGFENKRAAAKYSNTLYRSKGSLYSIQQFFRTFFGVSPDVVYTKENVFIVGNRDDIEASKIGPESQKYLTDDKLYQEFAVLIKADQPISSWLEEYKLFVHPAGMYVGGEVQIVSDNTDNNIIMPDATPDIGGDPIVLAVGDFDIAPTILDITSIIPLSEDSMVRTDVRSMVERYNTYTIEQIDRTYDSIAEFMSVNSPTHDEDSAGIDFRVPRMDIDLETFDKVNYVYYDSDSA
mgnify:FL=1